MFVCRLVEGGFTDLWLRQMNERAVKERRHSKGQVYESAGYSIQYGLLEMWGGGGGQVEDMFLITKIPLHFMRKISIVLL